MSKAKKIFISAVLSSVMAYAQPARADFFEYQCKKFSQELTNFYSQVANAEKPSEEQLSQAKKYLEVACGPFYAHCDFEVCKNQEAQKAADTIGQTIEEKRSRERSRTLKVVKVETVIEAEPITFGDLDENFPLKNVSDSSDVVAEKYGKEYSASHYLHPDEYIEADAQEEEKLRSLAWTDKSLGCGEFVSEMKSRYLSLGDYEKLPTSKKTEIRQVLDVACSPRFEACNFRACGGEGFETAIAAAAPTTKAPNATNKPPQLEASEEVAMQDTAPEEPIKTAQAGGISIINYQTLSQQIEAQSN
jgi:hypothetical protein